MTLYRHKATGHVVAAQQMARGGPQDDPWAKRYGVKPGTFGPGDFAIWVGGRHVRYEKASTFAQEYETV